jgi:hypothetical protein
MIQWPRNERRDELVPPLVRPAWLRGDFPHQIDVPVGELVQGILGFD